MRSQGGIGAQRDQNTKSGKDSMVAVNIYDSKSKTWNGKQWFAMCYERKTLKQRCKLRRRQGWTTCLLYILKQENGTETEADQKSSYINI